MYYKNVIIRNWSLLNPIGKILHFFGAQLKGRGRETMFAENHTDEIVRLYDGNDNPIGKAYNRKEALELVEPYFTVENVYLNFFPARSLPFKLPRFLHRFLSRNLGFMIHMNLKKI